MGLLSVRANEWPLDRGHVRAVVRSGPLMGEPATIEPEVKLSVWPGYALPDLNGVIDGGSVSHPQEQHLDAVYYDTLDLRLLRRGVTLSFRRGEAPGEVWTLKLPSGTPAVGLARREITVPGRASTVPTELLDVVRGWAMGSPLAQVARLQTRRRRIILNDADGAPQAVLDDDEVSILRGGRVAARFREIEVELLQEVPNGYLAALGERLQAAGAQPVDQVPKLVRALGPPALAPWELERPALGAQPPAAEVVRAGLLAGAARLVDHIAAVVLDEDPEGVHQARVGIRRVRSDLRTFRTLIDVDSSRRLRDELHWLLDALGTVRDLDVLLAHLRSDASRLAANDNTGRDELFQRLIEERAAAHVELLDALRSERCAAMLQSLATFVTAPPFVSADAQRPAAAVLPALVRRPLRRLRREADRLGPTPGDDELHRVRILAKHVRYAADVSIPVAGKPARRATRALATLQDLLGEHNDARVALGRLRELARDGTPAGVWSAGLLGGVQIARAEQCRTRFPAAYRAAMAKSHWRWIT
jgi:CHAD domain-containing protein